ncbi:hypothetical protein EROM_110290 [Encephalitozoon romaleae SJ-2008]|uniref:RNA-binding protein n=1 Tax=Encephalitozoon romaleae (strain SJ-2008) TaxID=1178016 RepID=I6ZW72_ENCRO|nr:hypothetical protein EROM_110290 [Encephalitozoon romaleae SJ-2008]AFN84011.1 hypothetical protein EROM_110290 [Encephalitozoon romaleae SJ-2008]
MQAPFDKHISPTVPYVLQRGRRASPKIEGISKYIRHLRIPVRKNELFVAGGTTRQALEEAFHEVDLIEDIRVFKRYAFLSFKSNANIDHIPGKCHNIGGKPMYVDYVRRDDIKFIPIRLRNRASLWYNHKNKFK